MATSNSSTEQDGYPCKITVNIPFPDQRLASTALRVISVDEELSPLVRRSFSLTSPATPHQNGESTSNKHILTTDDESKTILTVAYEATTNRMLRVAINGFFESVGVVLSAMRELDIDVVEEEWIGDGADDVDAEDVVGKETEAEVRSLKRVQGLMEAGPL